MLDLNLIILVLYLMFVFFGNSIIKGQVDNYDQHHELYSQNLETYNQERDALKGQLDDGIITEEQHTAAVKQLMDDFTIENEEYAATEYAYVVSVFFFFVFSMPFLNYFYNLAMKGQTIGRKIMKIRLEGKITWSSLLIREFLYKGLFWIATLSAGIAIDIGLIAFSKTKKTIRDHTSKTYLTYEGVSYPF